MKIISFLLATIALCSGCNTQNETSPPKIETPAATKGLPSKDMQIKLASLAAPKEKRDSAAVYGYGADGQLTLLRKGTNELTCLADDPSQPDFSVSCYSNGLEPFMQRGRELRKQGVKDEKLSDQRGKEVEAGTLKMPKGPAALYVYSAKDKDVDDSSGEVKNGYLRYVIYIPYATSASTGLPEKPSADGMPWIMDPGTYRAHIMINP